MESAAKRKAAHSAAADAEARPAKRLKTQGDADPVAESSESTTTMGLRFLESLKQAKDKTGRPIATHFLTLPDKSEIPEYYTHIKLPIALDTIEDKLTRGGYTALAQVESDCKRLVNNAKSFNDKKSIVYEDAERMRKTASNWMVKHNPAYRDSRYVAVPTPIPGEDAAVPARPTPRAAATPRAKPTPPPAAALDTTERPRRAAAVAAVASPKIATPVSSRRKQSVVSEVPDDSPDFTGKTFQQAQDQLVREMIDYTEPGDLQIFFAFVNLPSRSLKDYYQLIRQPMSLSAVQKKVRGVIGRNAPTGVSVYTGWNVFEDDMRLIWNNAREYNEDGSDIYQLSIEFETAFMKRLAEAKAKVEEPPQPKLKLNMPAAAPKQQLRIKLRQSPGSDPNTPTARSSATPGVVVDREALLRQQRHVHDSMNGNRSSRPSSSGKPAASTPSANPFTGPRGPAAAIPSLAPSYPKAAASPAPNGIKHDVQSPALNTIRPVSIVPDGQRVSVPAATPHPMLPPTSRPASGSPHPSGPIGQQTGQYPQYHPPNYYVAPTVPHFENFRKVPLKSASEALIPKITLATHPALNLPKPFSISFAANLTKSIHSKTISLPPSYSYLQIIPNIPVAHTARLYRIFVTVNGNKTYEVNRVPVTAGINGATMGANGLYEGGKKKGEPVFEAKLVPGVNRIEVEIVAERDRKGREKERSGERGGEKDMVDVEKCTVFVNLLRG
ncbi:Bromodomain-containing protein [Amniculicola lignicola CBS 123094]|uniref:Bromodomain-containing protein n=1 Tax=Amniculicola lignicola CBS 123094 TaxID=1392246 RepID=A0A6A5W9S6_9PLEO|nr:Bromodomain-containing protein [Amniculicola lignicola CBS 123094]